MAEQRTKSTEAGFDALVNAIEDETRRRDCKEIAAPRKGSISLYLTCDLDEHAASFAKLGKHKCGAGCLYGGELRACAIQRSNH